MMEVPLVSVLTPSFNQGRFLRDCIGSVLKQSYARVEHVICDGGSTDQTLDILHGAPETVRWIREPDRGQSHAINKALALSRGDIIGWLNSDDAYFDPCSIEKAVALFARDPEIDVVYGHSALVGADGSLLHFMWVPPFSYRLYRYANFIIQPAAFIRRSALGETLVDEDLDFAIDRELWLRLGSRGHRFARLDRVVAIDRHHETRKVYTMQTVGRREDRQLYAAYGVPDGLARAVVPKVFRIGARLWGVRLLPHAYRTAAFDVRVSGWGTLLIRQVAIPRRRMPFFTGAGGTH